MIESMKSKMNMTENIVYNLDAYILVKTSNQTLYMHEYNGVLGYRFQCLVALEPMNQKFKIGMILLYNM